MIYSWTLTGGTLPETPGIGGDPYTYTTEFFPPITSFTQQDILDMFDRLFPAHWLDPVKSPGPGYEVLQAYALVAKRLSEAVCTLGRDAYITSARKGARATGQVVLYRGGPNSEGISVTVKAGTIVSASRGGQEFRTLADVVFGPTDLGPFVVGVEALADGPEWNLPGAVITGGV